MTPDLVLNNLFEGKEVRVIEKGGDVWISTYDLAAAWGIDRTTPHNIIARNYEIFDDVISDGDVTSQTGICVNERGLYLLMGKITASRLKNPAAKEVIIRFQKWVPELIQKYRKREIVQVQKEPDYTAILDKIKFVNALHDLTNWNLLELQKEVLREAGMLSLTYHIEPEQKALPPVPPKPKSYLTAKDIGERIGKSAHEVYTFLYQQKPPLVIKDYRKDEWRITDEGQKYGWEESREITGGYIVWRIHWKKEIMTLFNVHVHEEMG